MGTFTATGTLKTRWWGSASDANSAQAGQGKNTSVGGDGGLVGIINFSNITNFDWSKAVTSIKLTFTNHNWTGSTGTKEINFHYSKIQNFNANSKGNEYLGTTSGEDTSSLMGTVTSSLSANTAFSITLSKTSNSTLFNKMLAYFKTKGNTILCLYKYENILSGKTYSENFFMLNAASITITYQDAIIYYGTSSGWKPCLMYYGTSSGWKQVIPYYGTSSSWKQIGGT